MDMCPYYDGNYQRCNISDKYQDDGQRQSYCMKGDEYRRCGNYTSASFDYKLSKKLRPDPAL